MREEEFRHCFEQQDYAKNTVETQLSHGLLIERAYGDLDGLYDADGLNGLMTEIAYSAADRGAGRLNPSLLILGGDPYRDLTQLRSTLSYYKAFRQGSAGIRDGLRSPDRHAVERAMDECGDVGVLLFMEAHRFSWRNLEHYAMRHALLYPSKAIFAVAHQFMPSGVPLDAHSCNGTEAHQHLASLSFEISKRPAILLFGKDGQTYEPAVLTNSQSGKKVYRYKPRGASNRTDDALETNDISELARAMFVDRLAARLAPSAGGVANYPRILARRSAVAGCARTSRPPSAFLPTIQVRLSPIKAPVI
jgi:5-methylcytosine-specific restriction protein B